VLALVNQAVSLWEEMRPSNTTPEAKTKLAAEIVAMGKGHLKELSLNHASSRAVQAALKHGAKEARAAIWGECRESAVELAMSPHGSHVIRKLAATASKEELSGAQHRQLLCLPR
jgi:pumilio homology domain family member 6